MQKENIEIKLQQSIIPEFSSGSSTHAVAAETTKHQAWKTLKPTRNETPYKDTTGRGPAVKAAVQGLSYRDTTAFTLIELLVVVLIIGILAAIALPQYQKAVDKSGFVQIWNTAKALGQAQEVYYLDHGNYANSLRALDVDVSKYANRIVLQSCSNSNLPNSAYIYHPKLPNVFLLWGYQRQCSSTKFWSNEKACYARKNDKRGNALCAAMTGKPVRTLAANGNCNAGVHCCYFF